MSRGLRVAFCGEGNTESRVVPIFIEALVGELPLIEPVDLTIDFQKWNTSLRFPDAVVRVMQQAHPLYHLVVAHIDADAPNQQPARERKVLPAEQALAAARVSAPLVVWAIPVQAIEAWLLVSAAAFAVAVAGNASRATELGFPRNPEQIHRDQAKALFEEGVYQLLARTRRHRRRITPSHFQDSVAHAIATSALNALRRLSAFQLFEHDLVQALVALDYVAGN